MFNKEVLSHAEKMKRLRRIYGATQEDIAGNISRSFISQIELNASKITKDASIVFANNFNRINASKKLNLENITPEFLMESIEDQTKRIALEYKYELDELKNLNVSETDKNNKIKESEAFINKYDVPNNIKSEIYEKISDLYFESGNYIDSGVMISMCIEIQNELKSYEELIRLLILSTRDNKALNNNHEVLKVYRFALSVYNIHKINNVKYLKILYHDIALFYKWLNKYDSSLQYIDKILFETELSEKELIDVNLLKGNLYLELNDFVKAETIYKNVLSSCINLNNIYYIRKTYNNLSELYCKTKNKDLCLYYFNRSINVKDINKKAYSSSLYYGICHFIDLNMQCEVLKYMEDALFNLDNLNDNFKVDLVEKIFKFLLDNKSYNEVESLLDIVYKKIRTKAIKCDYIIYVFYEYSSISRNIDVKKERKYIDLGNEIINYNRNIKK